MNDADEERRAALRVAPLNCIAVAHDHRVRLRKKRSSDHNLPDAHSQNCDCVIREVLLMLSGYESVPANVCVSEEFVHFSTSVQRRGGVEVMHARFGAHRFAPHMHDTWSLGAGLSGRQDNAVGTQRNIIGPGQLVLIPPYRSHAGHAIGSSPCEYVMIYASDERVRERARQAGITSVDFPSIPPLDPWLTERIAAFVFRMVQSGRGEVYDPCVDDAFDQVVDEILIRHARSSYPVMRSENVSAMRYTHR